MNHGLFCHNALGQQEDDYCANPNEINEVGCCSSVAMPGWAPNPVDVFGESECWGERDGTVGPGGTAGCNHGATYTEAVDFCHAMGARLCTAQEMSAGCTRNTGCGFDSDLIWTSTPGSVETENQCESSPCENGGTCTDGWNSYTCACADGVYGINCGFDCNTIDCAFRVLNGPCTPDDTGQCVGRPDGYDPHNSESCEIVVENSVTLGACPIFATEATGRFIAGDLLNVGGQDYDGDNCPQGVELEAGSIITWLSDGSVAGDGWEICVDVR